MSGWPRVAPVDVAVDAKTDVDGSGHHRDETEDDWPPDLVAVYEANWMMLTRLAFVLTGNRPVAEDLVQDVFCKVRDRWDTIDQPVAYLRTSVVNATRDWGRRQAVAERHRDRRVEASVDYPDEMWDALGRLDYRRRSGRIAVVAAIADGVSMADVTFDGSHAGGSAVAPLPDGNQSRIHANVGDLYGGATEGSRAAGNYSPASPLIASGTPVRVDMSGRRQKLEKVLLSVRRVSIQDGSGFELPGGEIRLDRSDIDGRSDGTDRLSPFGTEVYMVDGTGRVGIADSAGERLARSGYEVPQPPVSDNTPSHVYFASARRDQAIGVARALGLTDRDVSPTSELPPGRLAQSTADVVILLGPDYDR